MKFLTALSLLVVATFSTFTTGENNDSTTAARELQEEVSTGSSLRKNGSNRALNEGLAIPTESRIVGGSDAPIDAYPFFVSWGGCGASLVANDVILSAAHCRGQSTDKVVVGQSRQGLNVSNGVNRNIIERISHPKYNGGSINFDYLIMKLDEPVDINVYTPIGLNRESSTPANQEELTVIGFGTLTQGGSTPDRLQEVDVNYIPSRTCNRGFLSYNGQVKDDTMFCAGTGGGKDSCQGDSGGPIFTKTTPIEQVGIVSWGRGCAQRRYPGVYSRISGEYDWIKEQVCSLANKKPEYCNNDNNNSPPGPVPDTPDAPDAPDAPEPDNNFTVFLCSFDIFNFLPACQ